MEKLTATEARKLSEEHPMLNIKIARLINEILGEIQYEASMGNYELTLVKNENFLLRDEVMSRIIAELKDNLGYSVSYKYRENVVKFVELNIKW